jgi:hypothetical protein
MSNVTHNDPLEIPAFLRISPEVRAASWKRKRCRSMREMTFKVKHTEPADVRAFRLEQEKKAEAKQKERLAALNARKREEREERKRQAVRS